MMCHINLSYVFSLDESMNRREKERVKKYFLLFYWWTVRVSIVLRCCLKIILVHIYWAWSVLAKFSYVLAKILVGWVGWSIHSNGAKNLAF